MPEGDGRETLNVKYWDAHFAQDADYEIQTEYLMSFYAIEPLISEYLTEQKEERILIPACGNCNFSAMLYDAGWESLVSTDISPVAIDNMAGMSEVAGRTKLLWEVDDAMNMKYGDNSFDMVIDKSLLDCMYHVKETRYLSAIERFLHECCRVTKVGGICIFITARSNVDTCRFLGVADIELEQGTGTSEKDLGLPLPWKVLARTCVVECDPDTGAVPIEAEGFFLDSSEANMLLDKDCGKVFFLYVCEKTEEYDVTKIGPFVYPEPVRRDDDTDSVHEVPQLQYMTAEACSLHGSESDGKDDSDDDCNGGDDDETSCIDGNDEPGAEAVKGGLLKQEVASGETNVSKM